MGAGDESHSRPRMSEQGPGETPKGSRGAGLLSAGGLARALASPPVVLLLILGALYHTALIISVLPGREKAFDFSVFYCAGIAFQHHIDPYTADLSPIAYRLGIDLRRQIHTGDTPPAILLFQPFSLIPLAPAYWAWFALNTTAFVIAIYLLLFARDCQIERKIAWMLAALLLIHPAFADQLVLAQRQTQILLLLVLMMRLLSRSVTRRRDWRWL